MTSVPHWSLARIFFSSTFEDMARERDAMVQHVLPGLRHYGESIATHVVGVDLRWGVPTGDDGVAKQTVRRCLEAVDRSRPYLVAFVGPRRGWAPGRSDVDEATLRQYPGLAQALDEGLTITELEILHAVCRLDGRPRNGASAIIYTRRTDGLLSEPLSRALAASDIEARESGTGEDASIWSAPLIIKRYAPVSGQGPLVIGGRLFASQIESDLRNWIGRRAAADASAGGSYDERVRAIVTNGAVLFPERMTQLIALTDAPRDLVLLSGPTGGGKTTLVAQLATSLIDGGSTPVFRFLGYAGAAPDLDNLLDSIVLDLERITGATMRAGTGADLFRRWEEAWAAVERSGTQIVLLLDGLDKVAFDHALTQWLFTPLRHGRPVFVSMGAPQQENSGLLKSLRDTGRLREISVMGLETREMREAFIESNLSTCLKELDAASKDKLVGLPQSLDPRFLSIVLAELKLHTRHDDVLKQIVTRFSGDLSEVIGDFLSRLEMTQCGGLSKQAFGAALGALAATPSGLSTSDIASLIAPLDRDRDRSETVADIEMVLRHLDPFLQRRPYAHAFNSSVFAATVERRYLPFLEVVSEQRDAKSIWGHLVQMISHVDGRYSDAAEAEAARARRAADVPALLLRGCHIEDLIDRLCDAEEITSRIEICGARGLKQDIANLLGASHAHALSEPNYRRLVAVLNALEATREILRALECHPGTAKHIAQALLLQAGFAGDAELADAFKTYLSTVPRQASVRWVRNFGLELGRFMAEPDRNQIWLSPDERWLVILGETTGGSLWSVPDRREILKIALAAAELFSVAFSADSKIVAFGTAAGELVRLHVASGTEIDRRQIGVKPVLALAALSNSDSWAAADERCVTLMLRDETRRIDVKEGTSLCYINASNELLIGDAKGHLWRAPLRGAAPKQNWFLSWGGGSPAPYRLSKKPLCENPIVRILASPDGLKVWLMDLWSGIGHRNSVIEYALGQEKISVVSGEVWDVALQSDGKTLVAAFHDQGRGELWIIDTQARTTRKMQCTKEPPFAIVTGGANRVYVASLPDAGVAPILVLDASKSVAPPDPVMSLAITQDGRLSAEARRSGQAFLRDARTGQPHHQTDLPKIDRAFSCAFNSTGEALLIGRLLKLLIVQTETGSTVELGPGGAWEGETYFDGVRAVALHPDDRLLVAGDSQGLVVSIWAETYETLGHFKLSSPPVGIAVTQKELIILAEEKGRLLLFDGALQRGMIWRMATEPCLSLTASASGDRIFTGHGDGSICRWSRENLEGQPERRAAHRGGVAALHLAGSGSVLASGGRDGKIVLWDIAGATDLLDLRFTDAVENLDLSRDGSTLLMSLSRGALACLDIMGPSMNAHTLAENLYGTPSL